MEAGLRLLDGAMVFFEKRDRPAGRRAGLAVGPRAAILVIHAGCFGIEVFGEVTKLPLGLWVSGAVGNIATLFGALAECVRV